MFRSSLMLVALVLVAGSLTPEAKGGIVWSLDSVQQIAPGDYYYSYGMSDNTSNTFQPNTEVTFDFKNSKCLPVAVVSAPYPWVGNVTSQGLGTDEASATVSFLYNPLIDEPLLRGPLLDYGPFVLEFQCPNSGGNEWNMALNANGMVVNFSGVIANASGVSTVPEPSSLVLSGVGFLGMLGSLASRRARSSRRASARIFDK